MKPNNATYLFQHPYRHFSNSECYWAAYFALFLLQESQSSEPRRLPLHAYHNKQFVRTEDSLNIAALKFANIIVGAKLDKMTLPPFELESEWPTRLRGKAPDIALLRPEQRQVDFIEVKTIRATISRNFGIYPEICGHLTDAGWTSNLYYLLSRGYEPHDIQLLESHRSRTILWEDIFEFAAQTPVGKLLSGVDLGSYTLPAEQ